MKNASSLETAMIQVVILEVGDPYCQGFLFARFFRYLCESSRNFRSCAKSFGGTAKLNLTLSGELIAKQSAEIEIHFRVQTTPGAFDLFEGGNLGFLRRGGFENRP